VKVEKVEASNDESAGKTTVTVTTNKDVSTAGSLSVMIDGEECASATGSGMAITCETALRKAPLTGANDFVVKVNGSPAFNDPEPFVYRYSDRATWQG